MSAAGGPPYLDKIELAARHARGACDGYPGCDYCPDPVAAARHFHRCYACLSVLSCTEVNCTASLHHLLCEDCGNTLDDALEIITAILGGSPRKLRLDKEGFPI
jgi:hypothetical protein